MLEISSMVELSLFNMRMDKLQIILFITLNKFNEYYQVIYKLIKISLNLKNIIVSA